MHYTVKFRYHVKRGAGFGTKNVLFFKTKVITSKKCNFRTLQDGLLEEVVFWTGSIE